MVFMQIKMKEDDQTRSSEHKSKPSSPALQPKPVSMSKSKGTASRTEKKKTSSSLRLSMIEQSSAMKRAEEIQANLSSEYPSLVKYMLPSHTTGCFCLNLPKKFCSQHLPTSDTMMKLIDESGKISNAKFLVAKAGLSGGWRGFSIAHRLEEGDVVIFQLVESTTFKIYIIRRNALGESDGALGLVELETCADVMISNDGEKYGNTIAKAQCSSSSEGVASEVADWIKLSESDSVNLESFEKFSILLDGSVSIDAKFPDHIRRKYYDLCTNQNSCLHEKLINGLNCILVVGIINETVNISDAVRSGNDCIRRVPQSDELILEWDRTLQSFELLGMNVGFIRLQIQQFLGRVLDKKEMVLEQMEEIDEEIELITNSSCGGFGPGIVD